MITSEILPTSGWRAATEGGPYQRKANAFIFVGAALCGGPPTGVVIAVLAFGLSPGYNPVCVGCEFKASLWAMLRRPCFLSVKRLGEGCSSTAIGKFFGNCASVWNNHVDRGSEAQLPKNFPAVP